MKAIHVNLLFGSFVLFLSSEGFVIGVPTPAPVVVMTDAEKVLFLEADNQLLTEKLDSLTTKCHEQWEQAMDDLQEAAEDTNELRVDLQAADHHIGYLKAQMDVLMGLRSQDQETITDLNQQLLNAQSKVALLGQSETSLNLEVSRCQAVVNANSSIEVQALFQQWSAQDQTTTNQLTQQVLDLEEQNRKLSSLNDLLETQLERSNENVERLSEAVDDLWEDMLEKELDNLNAEFDEDKLEMELEHHEMLLEQCQEELALLKPSPQQSQAIANNEADEEENGNNGMGENDI